MCAANHENSMLNRLITILQDPLFDKDHDLMIGLNHNNWSYWIVRGELWRLEWRHLNYIEKETFLSLIQTATKIDFCMIAEECPDTSWTHIKGNVYHKVKATHNLPYLLPNLTFY